MTRGSPPADNPRALKQTRSERGAPMATGCLKSRRPCLPSTEPSTTPAPAAGHGFTMAAEKVSRAPVIDVFDRVLDKGIVFDASVRMSGAGIDLSTVDTDVIVA